MVSRTEKVKEKEKTEERRKKKITETRISNCKEGQMHKTALMQPT
jgi:hypothetical protein